MTNMYSVCLNIYLLILDKKLKYKLKLFNLYSVKIKFSIYYLILEFLIIFQFILIFTYLMYSTTP
jgi:hypothetical protein